MKFTAKPMWTGDLDICDPPERLVSESVGDVEYLAARLLVRCQSEPLGMLTLPTNGDEVNIELAIEQAAIQFESEIESILGYSWGSQNSSPGLSPELKQVAAGELPAVSVIIGTRRRPDHIVACVNHLLKQAYSSPFEVLVVDNGADNTDTADAIRINYDNDSRVRYLSETRAGLSRARNIGLAAARYPVSAFLSDDIRVDPNWLLALARGFGRDPNVKVVTGFCPPVYLETIPQLRFEALMAWGSRQGFRPAMFGLHSEDDPLHPYRPGLFANGSNMAFETAFFREQGGFDERLGPGTEARGGEDLDAPVQALLAGGLVAYEPAAVGWHADRHDDREFTDHMYTYGVGLTAFLTKHLFDRASRRVLLKRVPKGIGLLFNVAGSADAELGEGAQLDPRESMSHALGRAAGPFAYIRSRRQLR